MPSKGGVLSTRLQKPKIQCTRSTLYKFTARFLGIEPESAEVIINSIYAFKFGHRPLQFFLFVFDNLSSSHRGQGRHFARSYSKQPRLLLGGRGYSTIYRYTPHTVPYTVHEAPRLSARSASSFRWASRSARPARYLPNRCRGMSKSKASREPADAGNNVGTQGWVH